ncbi:MAG: flagellar biosynthesis protein FlhF [Pseudomonadota bacterium]
MKIKRFLAPTMREALRAVRVEQGPDAVILSNQRVGDYVEIIAALDYDEALINQALRRNRSADDPAPATEPSDDETTAEAPTDSTVASHHDVRELLAEVDRGAAPAESHRIDDTHITAIEIGHTTTNDVADIRHELGAMRSLLQEKIGALKWQEQLELSPAAAQMRRNLVRLGIADDVAADICNRTTIDDTVSGHTWRQPIAALSAALPLSDDTLLREGGIAAFVGPTGVGKTTTIAKIASQYVVKNGARDVALISMDSYRIGAQEQLRTFGRIINASVFEAADAHELGVLLDQLSDYKLILIDTEGVSQRDTRLLTTLDGLVNQRRRVSVYLTLAATVDIDLLDEVVSQYSQIALAGCVLTKIDEASRLGAAISVAIRHQLPLTYFSDGQRVPEDLCMASRKRLWLLNKALEYASAERYLPREREMAQRYMTMESAHG